MFEVTLIAKFDNLDDARAALSDMEEVVGKYNGDLDENGIDPEEDES